MNRKTTLTLILLSSAALAQTAPASSQTTLPDAVRVALPLDAGVKTAQANLSQAQAANTAAQADPSTLVVGKLNAANGLTQAQAALRDAQLSALQTVIANYNSLLEAQQNVDLQTFQVQVQQKALQIAQVQLTNGNATALTVQNAQNALSGGQQNLAAAQAALNLASSKLATMLGQTNDIRANGALTAPKLSASLSDLQAKLGGLTSLVTANNALSAAQLNVKLTSNDFTPLQTQQQAQTTLANAGRTLSSSQQAANQNLASAYQNVQNVTALLAVAQSRADAAQKQYDQDSARLQSGTIAATDLLNTQLALKQAQFALLQAQDNVLAALAALSLAAGQNLTGLSLP